MALETRLKQLALFMISAPPLSWKASQENDRFLDGLLVLVI
jgi:hypothetical protein